MPVRSHVSRFVCSSVMERFSDCGVYHLDIVVLSWCGLCGGCMRETTATFGFLRMRYVPVCATCTYIPICSLLVYDFLVGQ